MNTPTWVLLAFAGWTLLILFATVGVYRWSRILTGRATVSEWQPGKTQGSEWYQRAMSAHRNCVENLPVYGAVVLVLNASSLTSSTLDLLALVLIVARVVQSLIHICLDQTEAVAIWRFVFYFTQIIAMFWMGILVALGA
ncbi:MAPEG family protein [Pectobacterium actinidiae]|uniref:MAPEG family protein n=1 Tax=Pectobacterium actinidiae TaxID=1507808 RepID=UPI00380E9C42